MPSPRPYKLSTAAVIDLEEILDYTFDEFLNHPPRLALANAADPSLRSTASLIMSYAAQGGKTVTYPVWHQQLRSYFDNRQSTVESRESRG